jgi:hypothetical protein
MMLRAHLSQSKWLLPRKQFMLARLEGKWNPYTLGGNLSYFSHKRNQCGGFSKTKNQLSYYPAVALLDIHLKEYKSTYNRNTCTPMLISA